MRRPHTLIFFFILGASSLLAGEAPFFFKGIQYVSFQDDEYLSPDSASSLDELAGTGANWGGVLVTWYMDTKNSNTIAADFAKTPTDAAVVRAIRDMHARGLKVMLKPHVDVKDGSWRGEIAPADTAAWFSSYNNFITHFAALAQSEGVDLFCIGTELRTMSGSANLSRWTAVIQNIRASFSGPLTYASNAFNPGDEYSTVSFWSQLDYAGANVYTPLTSGNNPTVAQLVSAWSGNRYGWNMLATLRGWAAGVGKPVLFTEMGYQSIDGTNTAPNWVDPSGPASFDEQEQADCYEAAMEVWTEESWLKGIFWWGWEVHPTPPGDKLFSPRNKAAELVLVNWYFHPDTSPTDTDGDGIPDAIDTDDDNDGFDDALELEFGTSPTDASSTPLNGAPAGTPQDFLVTRVYAELNFRKTGHDALIIQGSLPVPRAIELAGQPLAVDIGGVVRRGLLNSGGLAAFDDGSFRFATLRRGDSARFSLNLQRTDLVQSWSDEGLAGDGSRAERFIQMTILFNGAMYQVSQSVEYFGRTGRKGKARR